MARKDFLSIESGIAAYQVLQRGADGCADVAFAGRTTAPDGSAIQARLLEFGQPMPDFHWREFGHVCDGQYEGVVPRVPAGGEYTLEVRVQDESGTVTATAACHGILVGDLWVLAGQSNMQGVGRLESDRVEQPTPLVHAFDMADRWLAAREPLHWRIQSVDPAHHPVDVEISEEAILNDHRNRIAGVACGLRFARMMVRQTGVPVGLVPCAVGGTSMNQWDPAKRDEGGMSLYGAMIRRVRAVGGRVKGMLWYQGESDTSEGPPEAFEGKFRRFVDAVRRDLDRPELPFIYVQIGRFVTEPFRPGWNLVQDAQRRCADDIPGTDVVPAVDLELDDGIHLSAAGHRRLGKRLAVVALHRLFGRDDLEVGPRVQRVVVEHPNLVRVCYDGVNGSLRAPSEITGFSVRDGAGRSLHIIYRTRIDPQMPTSVLLELDRPLPDGSFLWYGYGMHPWCNLTDEQDMGAPVFGPIELAT